MHFIDTHAHIYLPEFDPDRDSVVERSVNAGVEKILLPNIDLSSIDPMMMAVDKYHGVCLPMMGLHPTSVKDDYKIILETISGYFDTGNFVAVGEIGIDLYWDKSLRAEQEIAFKQQLDLAMKYDLPAVIHCRESFKEVISIIETYKTGSLSGVFHAFTGDLELAEKITGMGFYLGIGGIITFKNSGLDRVIQQLGPDMLVLETDSPYLAPTPFRGKRNECSYVVNVAQKIADIFNLPVETIADLTTANTNRLFKL